MTAYPTQDHESSSFLRHEPCPGCGSSDALGRYSDGHGFCFVCSRHEKGDGAPPSAPVIEKPRRHPGMIETEIMALDKRLLTEESCRVWNYGVGVWAGQAVQVAEYRDDSGALVAQKVRTASKDFAILGPGGSSMPLFGQHRFPPSGRMLVITEGELDAISISQCWDHKYPVVSVPNGAKGAAKAIRRSLEWVTGFDKVVFAFDMDAEGQAAAKECSILLPPGKAHIARLPAKDGNECLKQGLVKQLIDSIWKATPFRPDGIIDVHDVWDRIAAWDGTGGLPYPWPTLAINRMTRGIRKGEIVTVVAGPGIGKSQFCREIAYSLLVNHGEAIGYIALEESVARTAIGLMSIEANKPLHLDSDKDVMRAAFDTTFADRKVFLYDHFGSTEDENLLARLRYLVQGLGCQSVVLDHISIAVSAIEGDERKMLDALMTKLRALVEELKFSLILICHLKRVDGTPHEEGGQIRLSHIRGTAGVGQLSDIVIGLERNQQADGPSKNLTNIRILKNRFTGEVGLGGVLEYSPATGRLLASDSVFEDSSRASDF